MIAGGEDPDELILGAGGADAGVDDAQILHHAAGADGMEQPRLRGGIADPEVEQPMPIAAEQPGVGRADGAPSGVIILGADAAVAGGVEIQILRQLVAPAGPLRAAQQQIVGHDPVREHPLVGHRHRPRRMPIAVQVIAQRVQQEQGIDVDQPIVIPVVIPPRLQYRELPPGAEIPRVVRPRRAVDVYVPKGVDPGVVGGRPQFPGGMARRGEGLRRSLMMPDATGLPGSGAAIAGNAPVGRPLRRSQQAPDAGIGAGGRHRPGGVTAGDDAPIPAIPH